VYNPVSSTNMINSGGDFQVHDMNGLDQTILGAVILLMLGVLVVVKRMSTGSIIREKPEGGIFLWFTHIFNLFFLLIVNPLAGLLLVTRRLDKLDPTHITITVPWILFGLELVGLVLFVFGYLLMAWALLFLRHNYQVGGSVPRSEDTMVIDGPYKFVRHPMYASVLYISLGLTCMTQSLVYLAVCIIYIVILIVLIPIEETRLQKAYGQQYEAYRQRVHALFPSIPTRIGGKK
jgi:protein-S-isoprenylcysteine O-methyltransferase Ste14